MGGDYHGRRSSRDELRDTYADGYENIGLNLLTNRDTPLLKIKETGRYGRHGREQEERDKGSKKV